MSCDPMFTNLHQHKKNLALSRSAIRILEVLDSEGNLGLGVHEIKDKLQVSKRTVHYGLKNLLAKEVVKKVPNLQDLRQSNYHIDEKNLAKLQFQTKILMYQATMQRIQ